MSTYLTFKIDDLDAEVKNIRPAWANRSDYATIRDLQLRKAMAVYEKDLHDEAARHALIDNFATPIAIGTPVISLDTGDLYEIDLPADALGVYGDYILLSCVVSGATNDLLVRVPRMALADILMPSESTPTPYAFFEEHGVVMLYVKEGSLDPTSDASFEYLRKLDVTQTPTTTALDIEPDFFPTLVDNVVQYMESYLNP